MTIKRSTSKREAACPGQKYGRLTVIRDGDRIKGQRRWWCVCECGPTEILVRQAQLRNGTTQSCGCLQRERASESASSRIKHGHTNGDRGSGLVSTEYSIWGQIKQRCTNPKSTNWKNYGGRGIKMCDKWRYSFAAFLADVGPRPEGLSIGRVNNNGHYEPGNVAWQTSLEQNHNRRNSRFLNTTNTKTVAKLKTKELACPHCGKTLPEGFTVK